MSDVSQDTHRYIIEAVQWSDEHDAEIAIRLGEITGTWAKDALGTWLQENGLLSDVRTYRVTEEERYGSCTVREYAVTQHAVCELTEQPVLPAEPTGETIEAPDESPAFPMGELLEESPDA